MMAGVRPFPSLLGRTDDRARVARSDVMTAPAAPSAVQSRTAEVEGVRMHYLTAGKGPAVVLIHGGY
jgi:hypothetical protein